MMTTKDRVPIYLSISYCVLCGNYGVVHEHEQYEGNSDPLDYDNYVDTNIKLLLQFLLLIMNGMLCLLD